MSLQVKISIPSGTVVVGDDLTGLFRNILPNNLIDPDPVSESVTRRIFSKTGMFIAEVGDGRPDIKVTDTGINIGHDEIDPDSETIGGVIRAIPGKRQGCLGTYGSVYSIMDYDQFVQHDGPNLCADYHVVDVEPGDYLLTYDPDFDTEYAHYALIITMERIGGSMKDQVADDVKLDRDAAYDLVEAEIDRLRPDSCPGTVIRIVQMDNELALKEGLEINPDREFTWVWSVTVGRTYEVKEFFYGNTIRQAVERALKAKEEAA